MRDYLALDLGGEPEDFTIEITPELDGSLARETESARRRFVTPSGRSVTQRRGPETSLGDSKQRACRAQTLQPSSRCRPSGSRS